MCLTQPKHKSSLQLCNAVADVGPPVIWISYSDVPYFRMWMDPAKEILTRPYILQVMESLHGRWLLVMLGGLWVCYVQGWTPWDVLSWCCFTMLCSMSEPTPGLWSNSLRQMMSFLSKLGRKEQGLTRKQVLPCSPIQGQCQESVGSWPLCL